MYLGSHLDVGRPVLQRVTWLGKCTTVNLNSDNRLENMEVVSFSRVPRTQIQIMLFIEEQKRQACMGKQGKQGCPSAKRIGGTWMGKTW